MHGTPMDLRHVIRIDNPAARVSYEPIETAAALEDAHGPVIANARHRVSA
jgi:hypothetical protein